MLTLVRAWGPACRQVVTLEALLGLQYPIYAASLGMIWNVGESNWARGRGWGMRAIRAGSCEAETRLGPGGGAATAGRLKALVRNNSTGSCNR